MTQVQEPVSVAVKAFQKPTTRFEVILGGQGR